MHQDFTCTLIERLELDKPTEDLIEGLQEYVNNFSTISLANKRSAPSDRYEQLDRHGTKLWNLSTRLKREHGSQDNRRLCLIRVFALLLLDGAQSVEGSAAHNVIRLMKVASKTARICLDGGQLELCQKVMERAASYKNELEDPRSEDSEEDEDTAALYARLRADYFVLRTALGSKRKLSSRL